MGRSGPEPGNKVARGLLYVVSPPPRPERLRGGWVARGNPAPPRPPAGGPRGHRPRPLTAAVAFRAAGTTAGSGTDMLLPHMHGAAGGGARGRGGGAARRLERARGRMHRPRRAGPPVASRVTALHAYWLSQGAPPT